MLLSGDVQNIKHLISLVCMLSNVNPLVAELFCHKLDLLEIVGFLCTFLQHAVC